MARGQVRIPIVVDPSGVRPGVAGVERELGGLNKSVAGIGKAAKLAIAGFVGLEVGGKVAEGIKSVTEAAIHAEASQKILAKTVNNSGVSWRKHGEVIERNLKVMGTTKGFLEGPMRDAFDKLIASTHNQRKSFTDLSLAIDISRARHISLAQASILVAKTTQGNVTGLKRLGISTVAVTTNVDKLTAAHAKAKDSGQKFSAAQTEQYKAQLAAAKASDKQATAVAVLAALQKQFGGSGKAYADSTAGGIDKINAQVEQLKIQIGQQLLPYAKRFVQWLSQELPVAIAQAQVWIKQLTPTFLSIKQAVQQVVSFVRTHWSQISGILHAQVDAIKAQFAFVGDLIHGRWGKLWGDAVEIVRSQIRLAAAWVKALGPLVLSALRSVASSALTGAGKVADSIVNGIKSAPGKLIGLAGDLGKKLASAIGQAASDAYTYALKIGENIARGALKGVEGLPGALASALIPGGHGAHPAVAGGHPTRPHAATGAWVAGNYAAGDRVPAMLSGGEAVLNPTQIAMVNSGMSVMGALGATGAPTIGTGFATGKRPATDGYYANHDLKRSGGRWFMHGTSGDVPITDMHPGAVRSLAEAQIGRGLSRAMANQIEGWWGDHYRGGKIYPQGYATGGKPSSRGGMSSTVARGGASQVLANPMIGRVSRALARIQGAADLRSARIAVQIAQADARGDASGNVIAYQADFGEAQSDGAMISAILKNPSKALGIKGAKLTPQERLDLLGSLANLISRAKSDQDTINQLQHPDSGGGPDTSAGTTDTGAAATPSPDLQAQLDRQTQLTGIATRAGQLSETTLRALTGSGDVGTSNFANLRDAAAGGPTLVHVLSDARSLMAVAGAAAAGFGQQPFVGSSRLSVAI